MKGLFTEYVCDPVQGTMRDSYWGPRGASIIMG